MRIALAPLRNLAWLSFFGLILLAWAVMYAMARDMGMTLLGNMTMSPGMAGSGSMAMDGAAMMALTVLMPMWIIMMAAMMGPTFVPTARTYEDLISTGAGTRAGFVGLISGYLFSWFGFGALVAVAHHGFLQAGWLSAMGRSQSVLFSAVLLAVAGGYQFTSAKERCLAHCRSPLMHLLADWRPGFGGGAWMGARIGLFCIGCCWAIMMIGFVGGAMNLLWMGIATLIMTLEKLPDIGRWLTRPLGLGFLLAAMWYLIQLV
ncbi:DUF2182 domain-containing protein [Algicella marina]|uniref:DUF2182 domain-containing protein n=1 Tax=Algicella marina TaxID=2683284 RepID=A0A6P1T4J9_9RHOB|nr:DUF2182 domain-containing protein [Algicella marina]QHQ35462.1 DUF2182 domain-containing protein [Algicella marina]